MGGGLRIFQTPLLCVCSGYKWDPWWGTERWHRVKLEEHSTFKMKSLSLFWVLKGELMQQCGKHECKLFWNMLLALNFKWESKFMTMTFLHFSNCCLCLCFNWILRVSVLHILLFLFMFNNVLQIFFGNEVTHQRVAYSNKYGYLEVIGAQFIDVGSWSRQWFIPETEF